MRTAQNETSERIRVISGSVRSTGVLKQGVGFTVYRLVLGVYVIRWTFPVRQTRNIAVTHHSGGTAAFINVDADWVPHGFTVRILNSAASAYIDADFGFSATVIPQ